jgi:ABC-type long-subunit fatty acid transport system fused permease/ATPase subunit
LLVVGVVQQLVWQSFRYQTVLNLPSTFWAIAAIKLLFLLGKPAVVLDLIERLPKIKGNYYTEMLFLKFYVYMNNNSRLLLKKLFTSFKHVSQNRLIT